MNPEVKLCGTRSIIDLDVAVQAGADAIGIICNRGRLSRNTVDTHRAGWIIRNTPENITSVLVPRLTEPGELVELAELIKPNRIQLGENEDPRLAEALYAMDERPQIAQVFHVGDHTTPDAMDGFLDFIDYAHFDTFDPHRPGGTGRTHDWARSKEMVEAAHDAGKLALLAGGLTPHIVRRAIEAVEPDGVDVETGIKDTYGRHNFETAKAFVVNARAAFNAPEMIG